MRISDWSSDVCSSDLLKTMNFGSGGNTKAKAWKDIWGSGQGIGSVSGVRPVAEFVAELFAQYRDAYRELRSEEHTSELQSLMRISYAVFCLKKKTENYTRRIHLLTLRIHILKS